MFHDVSEASWFSKPLPRELQREVPVMEALLRGPSVMVSYAFILLKPVLHIIVGLTIEGRRGSLCCGQVDDGWSGLGLHRLAVQLPGCRLLGLGK